MSTIVIYKTKYGSTRTYAEWIAEALSCRAVSSAEITAQELMQYDNVVYGGGLYAEVINGVGLITKNIDRLEGKKIAIFTTGITPVDCRGYYDTLVLQKNFKNGVPENVRIFNFPGKMKLDELSAVHRTALKTLKKIMSSKKNPTDMEKLLIELCDADGDFSQREATLELIEYVGGGVG